MNGDSLDHLRIHRLASLRRSQHRSALFMLGLSGLSLVMACSAINEAIDLIRSDRVKSGIGFILFVPPLFWLMRKTWRRRKRILCDLRSSTQVSPLEPPDFSTLQDGSQLARSLEEMVD